MATPLDLVVVLPRFGPQITGGAEGYVHRLLREWVARGHAATVLTTFSDRIEVRAGHRVDWRSRPDLLAQEVWDGIRIERFPVRPRPAWDAGLSDAVAILERRRRFAFEARLRGSRTFAVGWSGPARAAGFPALWAVAPEAEVRVPSGVEAVHLDVLAPSPGRITWRSDVGRGGTSLVAGVWQTLRVAPASSPLRFGFEADAADDGARFAVRRLRAWREGRPLELWDGGDADVDPRAAAAATLAWGARRPLWDDLASRRYRGPDAPRLLARLEEALPKADAVLAGYLPFTLPLATQRRARAARRPFLLLPFVHANDPSHHGPWQHRLIREADRVLALTPFNEAAVFAPIGARTALIGGGPSHVCPGGGPEDAAAFRSSLNIGPRTVVVLCVARKAAYKGYRRVVAAVEEVARSGTDIVALWVGPDEDRRPVESACWRYAGRLDEASLCAAYGASDVFCLFSEFESFGMVVLDAWLHGLPVVVHRRCGPAASVVEDGVSGRHAGDDDLAGVLGTLAGDMEERRRLGARGRDVVAARFGWPAAGERLEAVVTDVQAARRR